MKKKKSVASVSHSPDSPFMVGASDVIRWGDVMTIQGHDIKVSKAVELGKKYGIEIAEMLEKDLKSKTGLLITFPMAMLMSTLQERIEEREGIKREKAGQYLLDQVKP